MNQAIILHHYENSPYAEKVRLMFGLTNQPWQSLISPVWPPRPNVDPLAGGYRRIPVAQMGADIFCDTAIIAEEIADLGNYSLLDPRNITGEARSLMEEAEAAVFLSAITSVAPHRLLTTIFLKFGPVKGYQFIQDRKSMMSSGTTRAPGGPKAKAIFKAFLEKLEAHLTQHEWLAGEEPSLADLAAYHPLWLHQNTDRRPLKASAPVLGWFKAVDALGHGQRRDIDQAMAFAAARSNDPRALPDSVADLPQSIGASVNVAPEDYGAEPVSGTLAALTENRIVLARETVDFGTLHVHFPRKNYSITPA